MAALIEIMAGIIGTNVGMLYSCIYASLGLSELITSSEQQHGVKKTFTPAEQIWYKNMLC